MNQQIKQRDEAERITLTMRETARILGLSDTATFYAVKRGEIPSLRIGKRVLIPRAGLQRLLNSEPTDATR